MFIPRYWKRIEKEIMVNKIDKRHYYGEGEGLMTINAWGYSDDSEALALQRANERIFEIEKVLASSFDENEYYPLRILHEDILKHIDSKETVIITRNRYGAEVLNSSNMMFIDIDVNTNDLKPAGFFQQLFGNSKKIEENNRKEKDARFNAVFKKIDEYVEQDFECGFLIYRTFAGLRLIATHKSFNPTSEESQKIFDALGTDPLYQKLCIAQKCFRARLTPKFWRMKEELAIELRVTPRLKYRISKNMIPKWEETDRERLEEYDNWNREYDGKHQAHATCKFIKQVGNNDIYGDFKEVIAYHDRVTKARSTLPLA